MSEKSNDKDKAWFLFATHRARELSVGGAITAAVIGAAAVYANRKIHEQEAVRRHHDLIAYIEGEDADRHQAVVRRTAAIGLVHFNGMLVESMKAQLFPNDRHQRTRVGNALNDLTSAQAFERMEDINSRKPLRVRPSYEFIAAVTSDLSRCAKLQAEILQIDPEFDFAELRAALPEEMRPEDAPNGSS